MGRIEENYARWCELATADPDLQAELISMKDDPSAVEDAFYRDLAFGTGGLRGVIGAGTNRMNVYTVAKASQGLANYILKNYADADALPFLCGAGSLLRGGNHGHGFPQSFQIQRL